MSEEGSSGVISLLVLAICCFCLNAFIFFDIASELTHFDELLKKTSEHSKDLNELLSIIKKTRKQYPLHKNDFRKKTPYCAVKKDKVNVIVYFESDALMFWTIPKKLTLSQSQVSLRKISSTLSGFYKNIANQWMNVVYNRNAPKQKEYFLLSDLIYDGQIMAFSSPDNNFSVANCANITY